MSDALTAMRDPVWRLRITMVAIPGLILFGTVGYTVLGMELFDALYMTLITISTVGFSEVGQLDQAGRAFTIVLICLGILLIGFSTTSFIEALVEGELARYFGRRRLERQITDLRNHWIVCGYGRMGELVTREIRETAGGPQIVVIDKSPERIRKCEEGGLLYIQDDATTEVALEAAGVKHARGLVSLVASDAENVFICLTARGMSNELIIVARTLEEHNADKLRRAGADKVLSPYVVGGHRLSLAVLRPAVAEFLEYATSRLHMEMDEAEINVGSHVAGKALKDTNLRRHVNVIVLAIRRASKEMVFNPGADSVLHEGDTLIVMGGSDELAKLDGWLHP